MNPAQRLVSIILKKKRRIIGLMSGMSMDGVDLACVDIEGDFPNLKVRRIGSYFRLYSPEIKTQIRLGLNASTQEISRLNFLVAEEFSACVRAYLSTENMDASSIDCIGSHGQTVFHSSETFPDGKSTLQIGAPSIIAELTGITTIGNFRVRDIAAGGNGAPLVSLADYVLAHDFKEPTAFNNLGSVSNLTVVTPSVDDMMAFDTGPANMAIDYFARLITGSEEGIDRDGSISNHGLCIPELLKALLDHPFFDLVPPKTAGYKEFGPIRLAEVSRQYLQRNPSDLVRTGVEFAAISIQQAYRKHVIPKYPGLKKAIFSGGGIYNVTLMSRIRELLPELEIEVLASDLADSREALAFAILANETLSGRPGSLSPVTGIKHPTVLGEIAV